MIYSIIVCILCFMMFYAYMGVEVPDWQHEACDTKHAPEVDLKL